jgi:hypothetical protein
MKKQGSIEEMIVYPVRMPRDVYERAQKIAEDRHLTTAYLIRLGLRRVVASAEAGHHEDKIVGL